MGLKLEKARQEGREEQRNKPGSLEPGKAAMSIEDITDLKAKVMKAEAMESFRRELSDERVCGEMV